MLVLSEYFNKYECNTIKLISTVENNLNILEADKYINFFYLQFYSCTLNSSPCNREKQFKLIYIKIQYPLKIIPAVNKGVALRKNVRVKKL